MTFLAPGFLWGLAVLLPLAAIYFLKVRPRRQATNAFFLWQQIFDRKKSSALFRRLRDVLSLLLLALVTIAIVLAMARPRVEQEDERDLLIVLDTSASMLADDGGEVRIDEARERARELVKALNGSRRAAIGTLSDRLRFVTHFTDSPKDLFSALRRVEAAPLPMNEEALRELSVLASDDGNHRVLLLTDGVNGIEEYGLGVEIMKVGAETGNAGIVAADLQWRPGRRGTASFFYKVKSSFKEEKLAELILTHLDTGRIKRLIPLTLAPGKTLSDAVEIENSRGGRWEAVLDISDNLAADNRVPLALNELMPVRVQVQAENPYFYRHCITAFEQSGLVSLVEQNPDTIVVEGAPGAAERVMVFKPEGDSPWWTSVGASVEIFAAKARLKEHPLLRHIDLETMAFGGAREIQAPDDALVLAESDGGVPLIYQVARDENVVVVVNADPAEDDFMLSPWFPVLIYDGARHLMGRTDRPRSVYPTGRQVAQAEDAKYVDEEGRRVDLQLEDGVLSRPGHYEVLQGGVKQLFGASLLNAEESASYRTDLQENAGPVPAGRPLAIWLLLVALLVMCVESILYHRRKVG